MLFRSRYLQKTDAVNTLAEDIEKYLAEPRKLMTEEEILKEYVDCPALGSFRHFEEGIRFAEKFHGIGGVDND